MQFQLDTKVIELWRRLSDPLEEVERLVADLNAQSQTEVFDELDAHVYFATILDKDRYLQMLADFYKPEQFDEHPISRFINLGIENVAQHADDPEAKILWRRGLHMPLDRARSLVVAQHTPQEYCDIYILDNGQGFIHPETGENTIHEVVKYGAGYGKHSEHCMGLSNALNAADKTAIISAGKMFFKETKSEILMTEHPIPSDLEQTPGALVFGRVIYDLL